MGDHLGNPHVCTWAKADNIILLADAVTIAIRAKDDSISGGGECETPIRLGNPLRQHQVK